MFPISDGPTHRYLGASSGCWDLYGRFLGGEYPTVQSSLAASVIDAYAAQHPGVDSPPARQSVAIHLVALHARIECNLKIGVLNPLRIAAAQWGHANGFEWLDPMPKWDITLSDVMAADGPAERGPMIDRYVTRVYESWAQDFGPTIVSWHDSVIASRHR